MCLVFETWGCRAVGPALTLTLTLTILVAVWASDSCSERGGGRSDFSGESGKGEGNRDDAFLSLRRWTKMTSKTDEWISLLVVAAVLSSR